MTTQQVNLIKQQKALLRANVEAKYRDAFGEFWEYEHIVQLDATSFDSGQMGTVSCRQYKATADENESKDTQKSPMLPLKWNSRRSH
jgi:hypothetical protein